ncbi:ParB/RepB/Spo0J family partition protein [Deinococcus oregonensis]|uniref:ParB/RepB/Spo0J family partition protein n=1 Tax=Deinococcus oregonensis TaxID=1805970 RepID=A0ABV6AUU1_9DEIO
MSARAKRPAMRPDLSALLSSTAEAGKAAVPTGTLPVSALIPSAGQPRRAFDDRTLGELAQSLRVHGILQPLLVRPTAQGHEIVAGERRWRAAQLAGLTEVPVIIREMGDQEARAASLVENLQRENLNLLDEVDAKLELVSMLLGVKPDEARIQLVRLSKKAEPEEAAPLDALFQPFGEGWRTFAKNKLRILNWPPLLLDALREGLPFTLGAVIAGAPQEHQEALIDRAKEGASRAELRAELGRLQAHREDGRDANWQKVAIQLTNRRWASTLSAQERTALEKWIARMPEVLKLALEK